MYSQTMSINNNLERRYVRLQAYFALNMYNWADVGVTPESVARGVTSSGVQKRSFFSTGIAQRRISFDRYPFVCIL